MALGDYGFLLIGGKPHYNQVREFDVMSGQWLPEKRWPKLQTRRWYHGCSVLGDNVVVAGGDDREINTLSSTEVLSISQRTRKTGGSMNYGREGHAMVSLAGEDGHTLYVMGGGSGSMWSSVERWEEDQQSWVTEVTGLQERREGSGAVVVPTASVCPT